MMAINNDVKPRYKSFSGTSGSPAEIVIFSNERYVTFLEPTSSPIILCEDRTRAASSDGFYVIAPSYLTLDFNKPELRIEDEITLFLIGGGKLLIQ